MKISSQEMENDNQPKILNIIKYYCLMSNNYA